MSVLSIQSHVVHGYVGNKAATFPLQLLGFDVDPLNTVQFSNHTGYPVFRGERLEGTQFQTLVEGLRLNGLLGAYSHVLTGYVGRPSSLEAICDLVEQLKQARPSTTIFVDPVMGDEGKLYVPSELLPIYRDKLLRLSHIVTPNSFEAELLTGAPVRTAERACEALRQIHALGPRVVIITSAELEGDPGRLHLFASISEGGSADGPPAPSVRGITISFAKRTGWFTGTGDLFAALMLAHLGSIGDLTFEGLAAGCEKAVWTMQQVLAKTAEAAAEEAASAERVGDGAAVARARELRIVQSRDLIMAPQRVASRALAL
ncbi:putative pyridoxal kinase [Polyrhizophydium stewartii]|uniref:pyridoxal kinase n=1 Tax=Polyrhizophydium stewartii TaxID=2732419 RepID=A0ABR4NC76_9FUNG|nr:hypothetical protein HK105_001854 [Polyrhizophydium stewartii]